MWCNSIQAEVELGLGHLGISYLGFGHLGFGHLGVIWKLNPQEIRSNERTIMLQTKILSCSQTKESPSLLSLNWVQQNWSNEALFVMYLGFGHLGISHLGFGHLGVIWKLNPQEIDQMKEQLCYKPKSSRAPEPKNPQASFL